MSRASHRTGRTLGAIALAAVLALGLTGPFAAQAQASAVDQYVEFVPAPGKERPTRDLGAGAADPDRYGLTGSDARAIARVASLFAAEPGPSAPQESSPAEDPDVASSILGTGSGGGMGLLLPLALLVTLAVGLGSVALRRRMGGSER
jgi:uncharacterized protein HemX